MVQSGKYPWQLGILQLVLLVGELYLILISLVLEVVQMPFELSKLHQGRIELSLVIVSAIILLLPLEYTSSLILQVLVQGVIL